jgi:acyl dehydratase
MERSKRVEYRVTARNGAGASENRIHADDVARRYGFRGGLVPGVTVYAYASEPVLDALGPDWWARGSARIRFLAPCYDGEELTVGVLGAAPSVDFEVTAGEKVCAVGSASSPLDDRGGEEIEPIPAAETPAPEDRPLASEESLRAGTLLGSVPLPADREAGDDAAGDLVRPAALLRGANRIFSANVVLPAWLHVGSEVRHRRLVAVGEELDVRGRIAEAFERKGHRFVAIDVVWMVGDETVAAGRHTAIWRLAPT